MTFLNCKAPLRTVMIQERDIPELEAVIARAKLAGADAFGFQSEYFSAESRNEEFYRRIFSMMDRPVYATNYRNKINEGCPYEDLAEHLKLLVRSGAALIDVMGDFYCPHSEELTDDEIAVEKQKNLIRELHAMGAEVLMSSHILKYTPADRILEIALAQQERGADIVKIVSGADTPEQEVENLRIVTLLKKELKVPFLYLSAGECKMLRRLGPKLGCCMWLCVENKPAESQNPQPLIADINQVATLFNIDSAK